MNNTAENLDDLTIPQFLQRKANPMPHIEHTQPKDTPEIKLVKKPRNKTELPTTINTAGGHVILEAVDLASLALYQAEWKAKLESVPVIELELRAINQEIRRKAK